MKRNEAEWVAGSFHSTPKNTSCHGSSESQIQRNEGDDGVRERSPTSVEISQQVREIRKESCAVRSVHEDEVWSSRKSTHHGHTFQDCVVNQSEGIEVQRNNGLGGRIPASLETSHKVNRNGVQTEKKSCEEGRTVSQKADLESQAIKSLV